MKLFDTGTAGLIFAHCSATFSLTKDRVFSQSVNSQLSFRTLLENLKTMCNFGKTCCLIKNFSNGAATKRTTGRVKNLFSSKMLILAFECNFLPIPTLIIAQFF